MMIRVLLALLVAFGCAPLRAADKLSFSPKADRTTAEAMTILRANCLSCHNDEKKKGGLRLTTRDKALKGGEDGPVLVPGKPADSLLAKVILPDSDPHMPPKKQLPDKDIATLRSWIASGAKWDATVLARNPGETKPIQLGAMPASYQPVLALALSPDERLLAVGRANHIWVHDLTQTNRPVAAELDGHRDAVQSLAWSLDGKWLASGGFREIVLWDMETPAPPPPSNSLRRLEGVASPVRAGKFKPHLEFTNNLVGRITALQFTSAGATLVAADGVPTKSGIVHLLGGVDLRPKAAWQAHADSIYALCISPDGRLFATGGADRLVKFWDMETHQETAKLEAHTGHVLALAFNQDGSMLATGSADKALNIWDVKTRKQEITLTKHPAPITALGWAADGKSLFSVCEDGSLRLFTDFKMHSGAESSEAARDRTFSGSGEMLYCLAVLGNRKSIFAGCHDGFVYVWNAEGKLQGKLAAPEAE